jgi:hypothetical protein
VRSGRGEARTILLLHIISVRPSKQPLMVRTFLKVYMELGSYFFVSARTNKRHHRSVSALEILCSDLRMSGFNTPAFVTPELSQERRKMLLDCTVHMKGHLALQPSALILTLITAPTLQTLEISCGLDSRHELTVLEEELDCVKFGGLGLANKHSKVCVYVNVYHTHIYARARARTHTHILRTCMYLSIMI